MARESDAESLLRLLQRLDDETRFMMYEPEERTTTVEAQRESLDILATGNSTAGCVAHLVVGVLKEHAGRGIETALLAKAERWARGVGLRRLELTGMTHNRAAVALYEKAGFVVEGTRRGSMLVDGSYVDEYYMARLLG